MRRRQPHTFLFALDDGMVIDATNKGNTPGINHSCAPTARRWMTKPIYIETLRRSVPARNSATTTASSWRKGIRQK